MTLDIPQSAHAGIAAAGGDLNPEEPYQALVAQLCDVKIEPIVHRFLRGNANADDNTDLSDAVFILSYLFIGGAAPSCEDAADSDDNGALEITDAVYLLNFLFLGGPAPADQTQTDLSKWLLIDLVGGEDVTPTDLDGGFFRAYIGVYAGDDATTYPEGKPFLSTDVPGTYTGTVRVTATVA